MLLEPTANAGTSITEAELALLISILVQVAKQALPPGPTGYPASAHCRRERSGVVVIRLFAPAYEYFIRIEQVRSWHSRHK